MGKCYYSNTESAAVGFGRGLSRWQSSIFFLCDSSVIVLVEQHCFPIMCSKTNCCSSSSTSVVVVDLVLYFVIDGGSHIQCGVPDAVP